MPSLHQRIESAQHTARAANVGGCVTCRWWEQISEDTRQLINEWLDANHSRRQLWEILTTPSEGSDDPVLDISNTGFRLHLNHHDAKCRPSDQSTR